MDVVFDRVAGLDIDKTSVTVEVQTGPFRRRVVSLGPTGNPHDGGRKTLPAPSGSCRPVCETETYQPVPRPTTLRTSTVDSVGRGAGVQQWPPCLL